jgi:hypothetical protein
MDVIGFLYVPLGSSAVQLHDSLGSRGACTCSEAGFSSQNGDCASGFYYRRVAFSCVLGLVIGFIDHLQIETTRNYSAVANSHTTIHYITQEVFLVCWIFTSRCLVTASNCGRSPSSGFPNHPRASPTSFSQQRLTRTEPQQSSDWLTNELHYLHQLG